MQKLAKNIYVESSFPGVTVGAVVTSEGIICIDTPTHPADAHRWRLKLAQLSQKPIQFIINLDHHRDRLLNNHWFEAPVIAHEATSERLRLLPELFKTGLSQADGNDSSATDLAGARLIQPQVTFADRMTLVKDGREIRLVHRPGSAPGAIWVEFPAEHIVFTGEAVTRGVPPLIQESDLNAWVETLAEVQKKKFTAKVFVPGRGSPTDKKGVKAAEDFLKAARRKVEGLLRGKKPRTEAAAIAEDLLEYFNVPAARRDHYTRRLRLGVEYLYDAWLNTPRR